MGRHSAPDDDVIDDDAVDLAAAGEDTPTGRHGRIVAEVVAAPRARPTPERLVERTGIIPQAEVEAAARDDAVERSMRGPRPAELLPVLPGEAIVPPTDDEPLGPSVAESVPTPGEIDGVAVLDAVLGTTEGVDDRPSRPLPRARVEAGAAAPHPDTEEPVTPEPVDTPGSDTAEPVIPEPVATDSAGVEEPAGEQPAVTAKRRPLHHGAAATAADLALLRGDRTLLARALAAFLTPFVLYVIALVVAGASGRTYLLWIWIPAIVACVGAGSLLDIAHKKVTVPPDAPIAAATELTGPIDVVPSDAPVESPVPSWEIASENGAPARESDSVSGS